MSCDPTLIAGGGIGGLATAIALSQTGRQSRILEKRSDFAEVGAGIQVGPNGTRVLRQLGAADRLEPHAGKPDAIDVREARSGDILNSLPLGRWIEQRHGAPYWTCHRADLHAALLDTARTRPDIGIEQGFDIAALSEDDAAVTVATADGRKAAGPLLVGADGVGSTVRRLLLGDLPMAPAGRIAARAVLPAEAAPTRQFTRNVTLWLAPRAHVVHYPVRGGREIAVIVVSQDAAMPEGWGTAIAAEAVLAKVDGLAPQLRSFLSTATSWRQWTLYRAPRLPRWVSARVALLGDATGPFFPFLAQGGVMALEEAAALASQLKAGAAQAASLAAFEAARRPRRERMIETAARNGKIYHFDGPFALARNMTLRALSGERIMAGYDWLYGYRG